MNPSFWCEESDSEPLATFSLLDSFDRSLEIEWMIESSCGFSRSLAYLANIILASNTISLAALLRS